MIRNQSTQLIRLFENEADGRTLPSARRYSIRIIVEFRPLNSDACLADAIGQEIRQWPSQMRG